MAPILFDGRDLFKLGFFSVLVAVLVFAAGFFMGHQRAADFYQAENEIRSLPLPEKAMLTENQLDSQPPEIVAAGEDIDVDQPDAGTRASLMPKNAVLQPGAVSKKTAPAKLQPPSVASNADNNHANKKTTDPVDAAVVSGFASDDLSKVKYSIQVGMYGRLANAENMMKRLQAKHYDAYVSDYTNKKNELRYNVRFGYFVDRKSAIARLKEFKAEQKGDGYLVNFSADNIVNIARAADVAVTENKDEKISTPAATPPDTAKDKTLRTDLSRADFFPTDRLNITTN